jgi:hypothetical protein
MPDYHVTFVGAGIACLYAAFNLKKNHPGASFIIIEKSDRIGGRIAWDTIDGIEVPVGAGVGRYRKDKLLKALLEELNIPYSVSKPEKSHAYVSPLSQSIATISLKHMRDNLKQAKPHETFREFGMRILGHAEYTLLIESLGYRDMEHADPAMTFRYYGLEDNYKPQKLMFFSWRELITKLHAELKSHIILQANVTNVSTSNITYIHKNKPPKTITSQQIIIGTTISSLGRFFPIYKQYIQSQPFLRVYASFPSQLHNINQYTITGSPLQKIIPIAKNLYMIAYVDNENAIQLKTKSKAYFEELLGTKIKTMKKYFHAEGTHYMLPGTRPHHIPKSPTKGVYVIGEAVSRHQGWVEGALETVKALFDGITN